MHDVMHRELEVLDLVLITTNNYLTPAIVIAVTPSTITIKTAGNIPTKTKRVYDHIIKMEDAHIAHYVKTYEQDPWFAPTRIRSDFEYLLKYKHKKLKE